MSRKISRRKFLKLAGAGSVGLVLTACAPAVAPTQSPPPTQAPPTAVPPTAVPPTAAPPTAVPPTPVPPTATAVPPTATPLPPAVLKYRMYSDMATVDPAFRTSGNDQVLSNAIHEGLVRYAPNSYDVVNQLAESIKQTDDTTIVFKLKEGVKWHGGYGEVTTEDVKFSYERFIDPALKADYKDDWANLDHVEIIDKYNGKIILKAPQASLWATTLPVVSGNILCKKYADSVDLKKLGTNPIGSGLYVFESWTPKQKVVLKANPDWHGGKAPFGEVQAIPMDDDKACEVALQAGEIDLGRLSLASIDQFSKDPNLKTVQFPSLNYAWFGMNIENPKLKDINVRQAIRYGIDVDSILAAVYFGKATRENALIPPGLVGYWKDAPVYAHDVAKAKDYLAKAGLKKLDLRLDILDTAEFRSWAEIAQQNLAEVGINITINTMDSAAFWNLGFGDEGKKAELFAMRYTMEPDPSWATLWFTTDQVGVWNWMRWSDARYDELNKKGVTTLDKAEREKIYIEMQQLWDAACHSIFVTHGLQAFSYKPTLAPAFTPNGAPQVEGFKPA